MSDSDSASSYSDSTSAPKKRHTKRKHHKTKSSDSDSASSDSDSKTKSSYSDSACSGSDSKTKSSYSDSAYSGSDSTGSPKKRHARRKHHHHKTKSEIRAERNRHVQEMLERRLVRIVDDLKASKQVGRTCSAHAAAWGLRLACQRIIGFNKGNCRVLPEILREVDRRDADPFNSQVPSFDALKNYLIYIGERIGDHSTKTVLKFVAEVLGLRCATISHKSEVVKYVEKGQPVVVSFSLMGERKEIFRNFFRDHPDEILGKSVFSKIRHKGHHTHRHAVVLTGVEKDRKTKKVVAWKFLNSWGPHWGCGGYFRVQNLDILKDIKFRLVHYHEKKDLEEEEKEEYKKCVSFCQHF